MTYTQQIIYVSCSGTLAADGAKFDASRDRGRPLQFTIGIGQGELSLLF